MMAALVTFANWGQVYQHALTAEILKSERRRVTLLAALFLFAAFVFSIIAWVPGLLDESFRLRFRDRWPVMLFVYLAVAAYEWNSRRVLGRFIDQRRPVPAPLHFFNAFLETSIPTLMLFIAVSFMGTRDALGSPAFLLYFSPSSCRSCTWTGAFVFLSAWLPRWRTSSSP